MRLTGSHSRRELSITAGIWIVLLISAIVGLMILRANAVEIINRIHYLNVTRGDKAAVLYAEAEKNARRVFDKFQELNAGSTQKTVVPESNPELQRSLKLFKEALAIDPWPVFAPERTSHYELLAQLNDVAGHRIDQLLNHARAFMTLENRKDALDYIRQARLEAPESPEPLVLLAQAELKADNIEAALAAINDVYTSLTIIPNARFVKSEILQRQGKPKEAIPELKQAVAEDPDNLDYRSNLGSVLANQKQVKEAATVMQEGLADGGWYDAAFLHRYGEMLVRLDDLDEAIRVLSQADRLAPYSGDIQFSLARAFHKAGKSRQAASALKRAVEVKPELQKQVLE